MLGSGLLLKIDEEKAHLPGLLCPLAVWTCSVPVRSVWAGAGHSSQPADPPRAAGRTLVRQGSEVSISLRGQ